MYVRVRVCVRASERACVRACVYCYFHDYETRNNYLRNFGDSHQQRLVAPLLISHKLFASRLLLHDAGRCRLKRRHVVREKNATVDPGNTGLTIVNFLTNLGKKCLN